MTVPALLVATILMWIAVIAGTYQRIFEMPKWFAAPPSSFELIRKQSKKARAFWIPLSILFMIFTLTSLVLNWQNELVRNHILGALACFGLTGALSGLYFVKEVIAFTKIPADEPLTAELLRRISFWLRWTSIRDILQLFAALFLTFAYLHA